MRANVVKLHYQKSIYALFKRKLLPLFWFNQLLPWASAVGGREGRWPHWIIIHGTDIVYRGLIVLFFGLFLLFFGLFSVAFPWKFFCRRPWLLQLKLATLGVKKMNLYCTVLVFLPKQRNFLALFHLLYLRLKFFKIK